MRMTSSIEKWRLTGGRLGSTKRRKRRHSHKRINPITDGADHCIFSNPRGMSDRLTKSAAVQCNDLCCSTLAERAPWSASRAGCHHPVDLSPLLKVRSEQPWVICVSCDTCQHCIGLMCWTLKAFTAASCSSGWGIYSSVTWLKTPQHLLKTKHG